LELEWEWEWEWEWEEEDNWYSLDQVPTTSHLVKTKLKVLLYSVNKKVWFLFYETFLLRSGPLDCTVESESATSAVAVLCQL
jgi:hypothetical protein